MKRPLTLIVLLPLLLGINATDAGSQVNPPPQPKTATPFGTEWAKPTAPNQGGYIYDDPRLKSQKPLPPVARPTQCPGGRLYDPVNQTCR
jgi:hypothetical protein